MKPTKFSAVKVLLVFSVLVLMSAFGVSAKASWSAEQIISAEKVAIRDFQKKMSSSRKMGFNVVSLSKDKIVFSVQSKLAGLVGGQKCEFLVGVQRDQDQRILPADLREPKTRSGVRVHWPESSTSLGQEAKFLRVCPK